MSDTIYRQAAIDALEEPCKVSDTWTDEYAVGERMFEGVRYKCHA